MKRLILIASSAILILSLTTVSHAQTTQPQLNQVELMKNFLGVWQTTTGIDTLETWEGSLYGNAVIIKVTRTVKGKISPLYMNYCAFNKEEGKLKGFILNPNASYTTWIGIFTSEKKFGGDLVTNLDPSKPWAKFDFSFETPTEFISRSYNNTGVKTDELKFTKIK